MFFWCWLSLWLSLACCCFCLCKSWFLSKKQWKFMKICFKKTHWYWNPILDAFWELLGLFWGPLGPLLGTFGDSWGDSWPPRTRQKPPKNLPEWELGRQKPPQNLPEWELSWILAALGPCLGHLGFNLAIFIDFSSFWGPPRMHFGNTFGKRVPCKDSWYTFLGCALDLLEIGPQARGTNRLDPPGVRRSPRSGLQF